MYLLVFLVVLLVVAEAARTPPHEAACAAKMAALHAVAQQRDPPGRQWGEASRRAADGDGTPSLPRGGIRAAKRVMILAYAMRQGNG